jgi:hypothetical protein
MSSLRIAKVMAIHPEGYSADLVFLDTGSQAPAVQILSPFASTNTGLNDLATPTTPKSGSPTDVAETKDRDIYAVVGYAGRTPVIMGFLYPQVCQMLFEDVQRRIMRHASDVYTSIDSEGNFEMFHPSGTYLRIGTTPAHEDLTGKDFDKKWKIAKNTTTAVHVHLGVSNAGSQVASIDIDPSGNITEQNNGNLEATVGGNLDATVAGEMTANVTGNATLESGAVLRLAGDTVEIHAKTKLRYDCDGNGQEFLPLVRNDYVIGTTGNSLAIAPPEIP